MPASLTQRRAPLLGALGFALVRVPEPLPPALVTLRRWLGSWTGIGAVITGMLRQSYDVDLRSYQQGWRATFLHRDHVYRPWVGEVVRFYPTPWEAVQRAAWQALSRPQPGGYP